MAFGRKDDPRTNAEKWHASCVKRIAGYSKARGFTLAGHRALDGISVAAIRDYTGHRVEVFFYTVEPEFDDPRGWLLPFNAASFEQLTEALVRKDPISKRQLVLPLEVSP